MPDPCVCIDVPGQTCACRDLAGGNFQPVGIFRMQSINAKDNRVCVLLVEDETVVLLDAAEVLQAAGHEVHLAWDGAEALHALSQYPGRFSALITDHRMPGGIRGTDIVEATRRHYPHMPIIIATGSAQEISETFRQQHRCKVFAKPYDPRRLVEELAPLLHH